MEEIDVREVEARLEGVGPRGISEVTLGELPFGLEMKRAMDLSAEKARALRQDFIAPEHLLVGLVQEEKSLAGRVLREEVLSATILNKYAGVVRDVSHTKRPWWRLW